jgi:uncharacterized membrane protein
MTVEVFNQNRSSPRAVLLGCLIRQPQRRDKMRRVIAYAVALVTMVVLDGIWLGVIATSLYRDALGPLMADPVNLWAAAAFYLIYPLGLVVFAVRPGGGAGPWTVAARGALFGLIAYATYDLTNLATLKGFPIGIALIDMLWGGIISAVASTAARRVERAR